MATVNKNLSDYNFEEVPSAKGMKIGIAVAEWNTKITEGLFDGAKKHYWLVAAKKKISLEKMFLVVLNYHFPPNSFLRSQMLKLLFAWVALYKVKRSISIMYA